MPGAQNFLALFVSKLNLKVRNYAKIPNRLRMIYLLELIMNFKNLVKIVGSFLLLISLTGCYATTSQINYWEHYTNCSNSYSDMRKIAQCGKLSRNNYLQQIGSGYSSGDGNMYVQFMDSLAGQVEDGKLSNNEARMVWIQRTQELLNGYRQTAAQAATANALQQQNNNALMNKGMDMLSGNCTLGVNC